ncbi:MAG: ribosome biogenesis GTPase Der [Acidobacteriota bacterium]|nr:ribosome biogenesis GTPase Der [Blastocatellia bacterium]MDW8238759.1 ribosome biogenesis GTPase Der [Acidobacteriota bacterium]
MDAAQLRSSAEPLVVIVGRPNVGKSTLFNRLVGMRRAIVGDEPGITRDRIHGHAEWNGRTFEVVDTGGIIPDEDAEIPAAILRQARVAIEAAQAVLLIVDVRQGVTPVDRELARLLHKMDRPVIVIANKADHSALQMQAEEFRQLGFDQLFAISAEHGTNVGDMLDALMEILQLTKPAEPSAVQPEIKLAIIGRPNVGKSTLVNQLLGAERVIVSAQPGTTRDAVDTTMSMGDTRFRIIDTAGIRRRSRVNLKAEQIAVMMARRHIERADVAVLLIDAVEGVTTHDARIAGFTQAAGKSLIIAVNKWDLVEKKSEAAAAFESAIRARLKFLEYAPILFISALSGQRTNKVLELATKAYAARHQRISTAELNRFFLRYLKEPRVLPESFKINYITQAAVDPPTFVIFTNSRRQRLPLSLERYVINRLREAYEFFATPICVKHRPKTTT